MGITSKVTRCNFLHLASCCCQGFGGRSVSAHPVSPPRGMRNAQPYPPSAHRVCPTACTRCNPGLPCHWSSGSWDFAKPQPAPANTPAWGSRWSLRRAAPLMRLAATSGSWLQPLMVSIENATSSPLLGPSCPLPSACCLLHGVPRAARPCIMPEPCAVTPKAPPGERKMDASCGQQRPLPSPCCPGWLPLLTTAPNILPVCRRQPGSPTPQVRSTGAGVHDWWSLCALH